MRRAAALALALVLALAVAAIAVAVADRDALVQAAAERLLRGQGFADPHVAVRAVGVRRLRLGPVRLGPGGAISAREVTIGYVPLSLVRGRMRAIAIDGLRAQAELTPGGVRLVGLPAGTGGGGGAPDLGAIGAVTLRDARIELLAPTGEAELVADGTYASTGADLALALEAPNGETRVRAHLTSTGPAAAPHISLDATGDIPAESVLWGLAGVAPLSSGALRLALTVSGTAPRALPALAADPSLDGMALDARLTLDAPGLDGLAAGRGLDGLHLEATGRLAGRADGIGGTATLGAHIKRLSRGTLRADELSLTAPVAFDAAAGDVNVRLTGPGRLAAARLASGGTALPAPLDVAVPEASLSLGGGKEEASARFDTRLGATSWTAPVALSGTLRLAGGTVEAAADARDAKGRRLAHLAGTAAADGETADVTMAAGPYEFAPGGLQPAALSPLLDGFTDARGKLAATLHFRRQGGRTQSGGNVLLDGLSFGLGGIAVENVNAAVSLASLVPPATPPGQIVTAGHVALVAALDNVRARFALAPGPRLALASATAAFAGGEIALGPATFGAGAPPRLTVAVRNVKIAPLLQVLDVAGLSGTGVLNGTVPLGIAKGKVTIDHGRLASEGTGVIQLRSEQAAKRAGRRRSGGRADGARARGFPLRFARHRARQERGGRRPRRDPPQGRQPGGDGRAALRLQHRRHQQRGPADRRADAGLPAGHRRAGPRRPRRRQGTGGRTCALGPRHPPLPFVRRSARKSASRRTKSRGGAGFALRDGRPAASSGRTGL